MRTKSAALLPTDEERETLGRQLGAARNLRGLSAHEVARMLGVSRQMWHAWERGKSTPSFFMVEKIVVVLNTSIAGLRALPIL